MGIAQGQLWSLGAADDNTATLTIRLQADVDKNRFSISIWNKGEGRRTAKAENVQVPQGGDLGDLGRVARDLIDSWLWRESFDPRLDLPLAVSRYYQDH